MTISSSNNQFFSTSDMPLAIVLSLRFPISHITHDGNKASFHFQESEAVQQIVDEFWNDKIQIEPKAYSQQLRILKSRIQATKS